MVCAPDRELAQDDGNQRLYAWIGGLLKLAVEKRESHFYRSPASADQHLPPAEETSIPRVMRHVGHVSRIA